MSLIWILAYIAVASIVMYWTVRLDRKLYGSGYIGDGLAYILISVFWPLAFPIFAAYAMAHIVKEEEE